MTGTLCGTRFLATDALPSRSSGGCEAVYCVGARLHATPPGVPLPPVPSTYMISKLREARVRDRRASDTTSPWTCPKSLWQCAATNALLRAVARPWPRPWSGQSWPYAAGLAQVPQAVKWSPHHNSEHTSIYNDPEQVWYGTETGHLLHPHPACCRRLGGGEPQTLRDRTEDPHRGGDLRSVLSPRGGDSTASAGSSLYGPTWPAACSCPPPSPQTGPPRAVSSCAVLDSVEWSTLDLRPSMGGFSPCRHHHEAQAIALASPQGPLTAALPVPVPPFHMQPCLRCMCWPATVQQHAV